MMRRWWPLLLAACAASGCASLADRIVEPHSGANGGRNEQRLERTFGVTHATWQTPQGVRIAYRVVPVASRGMTFDFARSASHYSLHFVGGAEDAGAPPPPVRGTVVYLHGWEMDGSSMLAWALALADRGYAGIAVDLRNYGDSSRAPAGFGPREAGDVVALLDALRARGELHEPVFLFGVSYGAATAVFAEAGLRGHVAGVVAMEPYANAADAIRTLVPGMLGAPADGIGERVALRLARRRYTPAAIEEAIAEADRRLHLDLSTIDLHAPLAQSQTCTLLLHGARDHFIPVAAARSLAAGAPRVRYTELPLETHMTLPLRVDWLADPLAGWFNDATSGHCAALVLPADPAKPMAK
jgi:pimeloyl-ACP methyl ester carboxylesterase